MSQVSSNPQDTAIPGLGEVNKYFNLYNAEIVDYLETDQGPVACAIEGRQPSIMSLELSIPALPRASSEAAKQGTAAIQFEEDQSTSIAEDTVEEASMLPSTNRLEQTLTQLQSKHPSRRPR